MSNQYGRGGPPTPRKVNSPNQKMSGHQQLHQTYSVPLRSPQNHRRQHSTGTSSHLSPFHVDESRRMQSISPQPTADYHQFQSSSPRRRSQTLNNDVLPSQYPGSTTDETITHHNINLHEGRQTDLYAKPMKKYPTKQHAMLNNRDPLQRSKSLSVFQEPDIPHQVPSPTRTPIIPTQIKHEKLAYASSTPVLSNHQHSISPIYNYALDDRSGVNSTVSVATYGKLNTIKYAQSQDVPGVPPRPTKLYSFATDVPVTTTRGRMSPTESNSNRAKRTSTRLYSTNTYIAESESIDPDRVSSCPEFMDSELQHTSSTMIAPTAIYGIAQGSGVNLVMEFEKLKAEVKKFYMKLHAEHKSSAQMEDLRVFLRVPNHLEKELVLKSLHEILNPEKLIPQPKKQQEGAVKSEHDLFIVDFHNFLDGTHLSKQVLNMFAQPGPPNLRYEKVDAKLNSIITEFCLRSESLLKERNCGIHSPAHIEHILSDVSTQSKVKLIEAFYSNQLWIRWATASYLPPLSHLFMYNPPTYEVRKAVTLALIAEKIKKMAHIIDPHLVSENLCPPIYARLNDESSPFDWQVAEYNSEMGDFVYRTCNLPSWMDESGAIELLNSSNRTKFAFENHAHALYSVYLLVIKDFSLSETDERFFGASIKQKSPPSKYQYYVGYSSTGTVFQFCCNENCHGQLAMQALMQAPTLKQFRCFQDCNLVDACLALSWLTKQPNAVFVLNSFITSPKMVNLSIERKKPMHDKMVACTNHLISKSKKLGPLNNMQFGMHSSGHVTKGL